MNQSEVIDAVDTFPMDDIVAKYAEDSQIPVSVARDHERELKRYLALRALNPDVQYGMAGMVDNLWHAFILNTERYAAFCGSVGEGVFIHHRNLPGDDVEPCCYLRTLATYRAVFGEDPPRQYWPRPDLATYRSLFGEDPPRQYWPFLDDAPTEG